MPRDVPEWIGRNDNAKPPQSCRDRVFDRQCGLCANCAIDIVHRRKHLDHKIRLRDGGENRESNLQYLCLHCHKDKTSEENKQGAKANSVRSLHRGLKRRKPRYKPTRINPETGVIETWTGFRWK